MKCNLDCPFSKHNGRNHDGTYEIMCESRKWFVDSSTECIEKYTEEQMEKLKKMYPQPHHKRFKVFYDMENKAEVIVDLDEIPPEDSNVFSLTLEESCQKLNDLSEENDKLKQFKQSIFDLIDNNINIYENTNTNDEFLQIQLDTKLETLYNLRKELMK